jgi:methionine sulfoxide reductase heme-binding subunit
MTTANRYWKQRVTRHAAIGATSLLFGAIVWFLFLSRDLLSRLSLASAYSALLVTAAALLLGPWNVLRRRANPISFDLRRDLGIWAGIMAVVHTAISLNVHLRGRPWLYFVDQDGNLRGDLFGFSNYTGAIATLLFVLLLAISNDVSLRRLGTQRWKSLQRWTYAAVALTFIHAVAYQHIEKRYVALEAVVWTTATVVCTFQSVGVLTLRRKTMRREIGK